MTSAVTSEAVPAARRGLVPLGVLLAGTVVLAICVRFLQEGVWDDGYMFVRYADNLLREGRLCWNPGGPATYGLTGLAFLLVVVPMRLLSRANPLATATLSSLVCGIVFLFVLARLVRARLAGRRLATFGGIWIAFALAVGSRFLCVHFITGLDTTFAMAFLTVYLLIWVRSGPSVWLGPLGGLAFWVRPDLLLFTVGIPALVAVLDRAERRRAAFVVAGSLAAVAIEMAISHHYLHSAVPLAFYAKSGHLYRDLSFDMVSTGHELGQFTVGYLYLFAPIVIRLAFSFRTWRRQASAFDQATAAAVIVFLGYHLLVVTPILGEYARFLHPALPAIVLLAIDSVLALVEPVADRLTALGRALGWPARTLALVLVLMPLLQQDARMVFELRNWTSNPIHTGTTVAETFSRIGWRIWYRLDRFAQLPDDLVIATTEVGHPGILAPRKTVIDMAGINDTEFALAPLSIDRLLAREPDLIYLPPPTYRGMLRQLREHPGFQRDYLVYEGDRIKPAVLPVALRRSSRHFAEMQRIMTGG